MAAIPAATQAKPQRDAGLIAGTLVETAMGWRPIELLRVGDRVQTYDGGLRQVRRIERAYYGANQGGYDLNDVMHVPGGALNNCAALFVMPDQHLLIESKVAADILGTPAVLLPAIALDRYRGITRQSPQGLVEAITLGFADEEVVYANTGVLAHCGHDLGSGYFTVLDQTRAVAMVSLLDRDPQILDQAVAAINHSEPTLLAA